MTLLLVVAVFALLLPAMPTTTAFADEVLPTAVSSLVTTPAADVEALLTPTAMQIPSGELDAVLRPPSDPSFHLGLWWVWWTPWGPWLYWWFPPP